MTREEINQIHDVILQLIEDNTEYISDGWDGHTCFIDGGRDNIENGIKAILENYQQSPDKIKLPLDVEI